MKMNQVVQMMKQWTNRLPLFLTSVPDQMRLEQMSYIRQLQKQLSRDNFHIPLGELKVVVFDFETTGFQPHKGDRILSIGAVQITGAIINDATFYSCVHTSSAPSKEIQELTGITREELRLAPPLADVLRRFLAFSEGTVLVAHHANHERAFLTKATQELWRTPFQQRIIDTALLMKLFQPITIPPSLDECCAAFNIHIRQRHHALEDALATAQLWVSFINKFQQLNYETLEDVYTELAKK